MLFENGAQAERDLQAAEDAAQRADADAGAAEAHLRLLGVPPEQRDASLTIRATSAGTVVEQNVAAGTAARSTGNSPNLFTIADLSVVWVVCDVFENDLVHVSVGDQAELRMNAWPDTVLKARVVNIGAVLDAVTRSAKVRLEGWIAMIARMVEIALGNQVLVVAAALLICVCGFVSIRRLPVEAYPDVASNGVLVITQWPGRAAEEVEHQVTIPIEAQVNGVAHLSALRSQSLFGFVGRDAHLR